ncbi:MAG: hypothetical protein U5S82_00220 [Gammaproteobacteria bacterium]|nr:hypothetical protein [Gammaproteobacteria bacterium]
MTIRNAPDQWGVIHQLPHVAGALRHKFVLQNSTLRRMLPLVPRRRQTEDLQHGG